MDLLDYDTTADYTAISELIRLVRRCGGQVSVFSHTAEEAAKLIEAFAYKPRYRNGFRLDNLAEKGFSREILLAIAKDIPQTLKDKVSVDVVDAPSFSDASNYKNVLGEEEIISWLTSNRQSAGSSDGDYDRFKYDARSLIAIGMCRRDNHPQYIEQARAMLVTQDPWLNRCLKEVYKDHFKHEVLYSITDTELVSLLWLQDYKQRGNLPSDILIANAHAACRVSIDVMNRAMDLAYKMADSGIIPQDAALLVSSHSDFRGYIANRVRNDAAKLDDEVIRSAVEDYISKTSTAQIQNARDEEREHAKRELATEKERHEEAQEELTSQLRDKDQTIANLKKEIVETKTRLVKEAEQNKCARAKKKAQRFASAIHDLLYAISITAAITLVIVFAIHLTLECINGGNWLPYAVVEAIAFVSCPIVFISKKSVCYKLICRIRDRVYSAKYSKYIDEENV